MHEASLYVNTSWIKFMPDTSAAVFLSPRFLLYFMGVHLYFKRVHFEFFIIQELRFQSGSASPWIKGLDTFNLCFKTSYIFCKFKFKASFQYLSNVKGYSWHVHYSAFLPRICFRFRRKPIMNPSHWRPFSEGDTVMVPRISPFLSSN